MCAHLSFNMCLFGAQITLCVFILSLPLFQPQTSQIVSSEKVTDMPQRLLTASSDAFIVKGFHYSHCRLQFNPPYYSLMHFCFSLQLYKKGSKSASCVSPPAVAASACVSQSISTYCRGAFCSQVSVSAAICLSTCLS